MDSLSLASTASSDSGGSLLIHSKSQKTIQWWFFGPVILAIFMFLLMGTIFERRIEGAWRNLLERRQGRVQTEPQESQVTPSLQQAIKTPSQRTVASCKGEATITLSVNDIKQETRSLY